MDISFYKKVDRSLLEWGTVIPNKFVKAFEAGRRIRAGDSRPVNILWKKGKYFAEIRHVKRKDNNNYYYLRWSGEKELLNRLREEFIQTYIISKSQKELFGLNKKESRFRTKLKSGQEEVLVIIPINSQKIELDVFISIENEWNFLFRRLARENVFGWLFDKDKKYLISKSTKWLDIKEFPHHRAAENVIYYLLHTKRKLLYIGKAKVLGKRIGMDSRKHQGMPDGWDRFRYDIVKPEYSNILDKIEDHTIRSFASILKNKSRYLSLEISNYKLVNRIFRDL